MTQTAEATPNIAAALIDTLIASNRGDRHAFAFGEKRYSYQDVAALMNRAGNMMKALGVEPGAAVLLLLPGSPAFVASLLGAIKAGAMPILGAAANDETLLQRCITATGPSLVVTHQDHVANIEGALSLVPRDAVVVVGGDAEGHKSFVAELRGQSSWLSAEPVGGDASALGVWTGSSLRRISHAELSALLDSHENATGPADPSLSNEVIAALAMLRAFSRGEVATLP